MRANTRGTGHVRRSRNAAAAESAACVQRPRSSSTRARQAARNRRAEIHPALGAVLRQGPAPGVDRGADLRLRVHVLRRLRRERASDVCPNCGGGFAARPIGRATEWRPGLSGQATGPRASACICPTHTRTWPRWRRGSGTSRPRSASGNPEVLLERTDRCRPWLMPSTRSPPVGPGRWSSSGARRASARPLWFGSSAISDATRRGSSGRLRGAAHAGPLAPLFDVLAVRSQLEGHGLFLVHALGAMFRLRAVASSSTAHLDPAHRIDRNPGARRHQGARGPAAADQASSRA